MAKLLLTCVVATALFFPGCKRGGRLVHGDPAYVSAPQVNLRDRLSAIYNKTGMVKNGERVEILERSKRFVRVRSPRGEEGWMEERYLAGADVAAALDTLAKENRTTPVQSRGTARSELRIHVSPGRDTDSLFRLDEGAKIEILKRATAEKPAPKLPPAKEPDKPATGKNSGDTPAPLLEDWWLVRDAQGHTGWVLARMVDVDVPIDVAQYAEGQRIMAAFVLDYVPDVNPETGETRQVPQYLTLVNEPKDGTPWDYNQIRVFTWNPKRHRYETAYRERGLYGVLPVTVGHQVFDKEGDLPIFTLRTKDDDTGNLVERIYKLNQPIVRRVVSPEQLKAEQERKAARRQQALQERAARRSAGRR